jgi:hypothetical protein
MTPTSLVTGTSLMTSFSTVTYCVICEFVKRFKKVLKNKQKSL